MSLIVVMFFLSFFVVPLHSKAAKREEDLKQRAREKQKDEKEKERKRADRERAALQTQLEEANSLVEELKQDLKSERETVRFAFFFLFFFCHKLENLYFVACTENSRLKGWSWKNSYQI